MNHKKVSDQQLLQSYLSGEEPAITVLINRHQKRIFDYVNIMVKDPDVANDIIQEVLIKIVRFLNEGRYKESGKFLSWALRIAHNQVIDHFRQVKQINNVSEREAGYDLLNDKRLSDKTVEDQMITQQIEEDVRKLLGHLPQEQRDVVLMRYYNGLSFKEIADEMDISINTALGRMRYALINLRKLIDENHLILT